MEPLISARALRVEDGGTGAGTYVRVNVAEDPHASAKVAQKPWCRCVLTFLLFSIFAVLFVLPTLPFVVNPVYSNGCNVDEAGGAKHEHHHSLEARSLKEGESSWDIFAFNAFDSSNADGNHSLCVLRSQSRLTLLCAAALLVLFKFCGFESKKQFCTSLIGSTDATSRSCLAALLFRLSSLWSFWGMMSALVMTVMKHQARFSEHNFAVVNDSNSHYYLMQMDSVNTLKEDSFLKDNCASFDGYSDIRYFGWLAFGMSESLTFLLGALLFGLGELFKLDIAKGYLVQGGINLDFVGFFSSALVGDKLIAGYDSLIGKLKGFTKKYAGDIDKLQKELTDMEDLSMESLQGPAKLFEDFATKQALVRLRPIIEPKLDKEGLAWDDSLPVLESLDSPEQLEQAVKEPDKFFQKLAQASGPAAKKVAIAKVRPKLEPVLKERGLRWATVQPVISNIDSIPEIQDAIADPAGFLERLGNSSIPLAQRLALQGLKPMAEPQMKEKGLEWQEVEDDLLIVLVRLDTIDEIKQAAAQPEQFTKEVAVIIARKVALKALKPKLEPKLKEQGLDWQDAAADFEEIDTVEEIEKAVANPDEFFKSLEAKAAAMVKKVAVAKLRPQIEPKLKDIGLQWADVLRIFSKVDSVEELQKAAADPMAFLKEFIPKKKAAEEEKDVSETHQSVNEKEQAKMVWPAVLQCSAAALWISVAYIDIHPCVGYNEDASTSILFGLYDFDAGIPFMEFVVQAHMVMVCCICLLFLLLAVAIKLGWTRLEKSIVVFMALSMMTYSVVLSTYKSPEKMHGAMSTTTTTTWGAAGAAKRSFEKIGQGISSAPIAMVALAGYATEAAVRAVASRISPPSIAEVVTYKQHRCKVLKEKSKIIAKLAPSKLKAKAQRFSAAVCLAADEASENQEERVLQQAAVVDGQQPDESMWMASLRSDDSAIGKLIARELEAKRKGEEEARKKADEARRKAEAAAAAQKAQAAAAHSAQQKKDAEAHAVQQKEAAQEELKVALKDPVPFTQFVATFKAGADAVITKVSAVLHKYPSMPMRITGHTGCTCPGQCKPDSVKLSEERAAAVMQALQAKGVKNKLSSTGLGCKDRLGPVVTIKPV